MKFLTQNLWLIGLAIGSAAMLVWPMLRRGAAGATDVSPSEAVLLLNRENALMLDVRNEAEFATGHIAEASNIPLSQLEERLAELARYKDQPLLVNCQGGVRSANACAMLKKGGFTRVYNLKGGINAWTQANMPVIRE
ncbi:MAG TPA: rhodanese-like domain-containing protein [Methylophilaceae bacterium]|nr:rhodanese-like domain-containing protein [Methylophilaceae bacterium]HQR60776.1 rhodanese-like domain-containing protein [Methylophilaceae bacterium]